MNRSLLLAFLLLFYCSLLAQKTQIESELAPLSAFELLRLESIPKYIAPQSDANSSLPAFVDNSLLSFFRPLFNQSGLECGQAASIGLTFTYEIDVLRNLPANVPQNQYATHFTYNFINGGSDAGVSYFETWEIVKRLGNPTVADYGGLSTGGASRWMTGYDKYYNSMHNRVQDVYAINSGDEAGLSDLKGWLFNHNGASTIGGLANIYIQYKVPDAQLAAGTPEAGKWVITTWGGSPNHAITLVGYNDSVRYDYNNDGKYTNTIDINGDGIVTMKDWEIGAFKIANTYGGINNWGNLGFSFVMYKTFADNLGSGGIWNHTAHVIKVKQDVAPKLTFKVKLKHTSRNKIKIMAGVAQSTSATEPDVILPLPVFDYQGGDKFMTGGTTEADKTIEIGLDATPLLSSIASGVPAKYFLIVDEDDPGALASGEILNFSLMNYNGPTTEIPCATSNVSLLNNDTTTLTIIANLNFNLPSITTSSLPEAKIYEPYSYQLTSAGGTPQHSWKFMCDYTETNFITPFPSVTANQLTISNTASGFAEVILPFEFPFFGKKYTKLYAHVDGYLMFEPDLYPWTFIIYEKTFFKNTKNISPYMAKPLTLFPGEGDGIWYQADANGIIFRWKSGMYGSGPTTDLNYAVKLFSDGRIEFYYGTIASNSWVKWNAGISNGDGVNFKVLSITDSVSQPTANSAFALSTLPFTTELTLSDNGVLSGVPAQDYNNVSLKFYMQDNDNLFTTKVLDFNTKGLQIQYSINSGGDSLLDYGETAYLTATLKNIGGSPQNNVILNFSTDNTYVSLIDSVQVFGTIAPGESKTISNAIQFVIDNQVPDGYLLHTVSQMESTEDQYTRNLIMTVSAPRIHVAAVTITDGNNNVLMPGETANLALLIKNSGCSAASNVLLSLLAIDPYLTINQSSYSIPLLNKQTSQVVYFSVTVSPSCPNGYVSLANLIISADNDYSAVDSVFFNVGLIAEDFETANFLKYPWLLAGNSPWVVSSVSPFEGTYSANSPALLDNQLCSMAVSMNVLCESQISFYYKVSSENNYDFLRFYIDGVEQGRWSGEVNWTKGTFPVTTGQHTFTWTYSKDNSVVAGSDKAWVDFIVWPPEDNMLLIVNAGIDDYLCSPSAYPLNPVLINSETSYWTTSGDGFFDNPAIANTLYHAGAADIIAGSVVLTLHAVRNGMNTLTDALTLNVLQSAFASCGNDASVCQHSAYQITQASVSDFLSLTWSSTGDGVFSNSSIVNPEYIPGNIDKLNGNVHLILTATSVLGCANAIDTMILVIHPFINANAGTDQIIDFGAYAQLQGTATGSNSFTYHWEPSDKVLTPNAATTYTANLESTTTFILKASDSNTGCFNQDTTVVQVLGAPLSAQVSASPASICRNQNSQLNVIPYGGSGMYTYNWTSIPAGFTASIANPIVQPLVTTQYNVIVNDGIISIESSIVVNVDTILPSTPEKPIGPEMVNVITTPSSAYTTISSVAYSSYNWLLFPIDAGTLIANGSQCSIEWNPLFSGIAELSVSAENSCGLGAYSTKLEIFASPNVKIAETDLVPIVKLWPNPAISFLSVSLENIIAHKYAITNNLGIEVVKGDLKTLGGLQEIDISILPQGLYYIHILAGKIIYKEKFVKIK